MVISNTTIRMAAKRGIAITITENDKCVSQSMFARDEDMKVTTIEIGRLVNDEASDSYDALYVANTRTKGITFISSLTDAGEEFPVRFNSDKELRATLDAIAAVIN